MNASLLRSLSSFARRTYSTKLPQELVFPLGNKTIVSWHPEKHFPYEHSLPLPAELEDKSPLSMKVVEARRILTPPQQEVVVSELAKMTYTTKHRWRPRSRDKKAKKLLPDRPYL